MTITAGVALVGYVSIAGHKDSSEGSETSMLGISLILIAMCFMGGQLISEEKFLSTASLDPLYVVGFEGMWGCIFMAVLLPIFQNFECTGQLCPRGRLEDTFGAIKELN